jgi:hypothetical protein
MYLSGVDRLRSGARNTVKGPSEMVVKLFDII